ncbi:hypothetical protein VE04_05686 [Pseudogymnoascus sp. 24MN13]|nr:hypothetical protein VE04_05686 [Pseudogymnoascus sp. 24MN13]
MRIHRLALAALILAFTSEIVFGQEVHDQLNARDVHQKRNLDSFEIFNRKRNAHACIMSIVFIVLFPLGAISIHLPIDRVPYLKNTYLKKKVMAIHVPIQVLGSVMMVGGMALGIRIGQDLGYLRHPVHAHVVIGFVVVCTIIVFQPIMGILQHRHFKKRGDKSIFAYLHRWIGRGAIILGMINSGLGFQLAQTNVIVSTGSYIRNYVLLGFFVSIWLSLVLYDEFKMHQSRFVTSGIRRGCSKRDITREHHV